MDKSKSKATMEENESKCLHIRRLYLNPGQTDFSPFFRYCCNLFIGIVAAASVEMLRLPLKLLGVEMSEISKQLAEAEWNIPNNRCVLVIFISFTSFVAHSAYERCNFAARRRISLL